MKTDADDFLSDMFEEARATPAPVSGDLLARVLSDAAAANAPTGWRGLLAVLGGWPTMGGLVAAGVAGLWIGVAPPAAVSTLSAELLGQDIELDLWSDVSIGTEDWIDG